MGNVMRRQRQSGAALLLALLIMTLVATLAAGMVWLQWRGIEVEAAERARTQAEWLLNASLDWGNLILKSSNRPPHTEDDLGQPWATPLEETKLSSFLSADGKNRDDDTGPEAYLSGQITDADGKYNVYNVLLNTTGGKFDEINRLKIICSAIGVALDTADKIGAGLRESDSAATNAGQNGQNGQAATAVLMPIQVADLAWYGIDPKVLKQLEPFIELLPGTPGTVTNINLNTAPAEVLMAAMPGLTRTQAQQLMLSRQQHPFSATSDALAALNISKAAGWTVPEGDPPLQWDVKSFHFEIFGQLRYEQHVIRELSVVYRSANSFDPIKVLRRERLPPNPA